MIDIIITTKTVFKSGDIHYFHFDNIKDCIKFIDQFETLVNCSMELNDDIEATYVEFSDGTHTIQTVL